MPKPVSNATPFWTLCAAAAAALLCFLWAISYALHARNIALSQARLSQADEKWMDGKAVPSRSSALRQLARLHEKNSFPPQYPSAQRHLKQAIQKNPLQSVLWMDLARCQLFSGKRDAAQASLLRSDELDPQYPLQRLEAIRLWHLLDQPERARTLALRLGRMTGSVQVGVIRELLASGYAPAEIYDLLRFATLAPDRLAEVLRHLRVDNAQFMQELFRKIPDTAYEDEIFRREAVRMALNPLVPEAIYKAWRVDSPAPAHLLDPDGAMDTPMLAANLDLSTPAFSSALPLGWQNVSEVPWIAASWIAPTQATVLQKDPGFIRLVFDDSPERPSADYRWLFYRMIVPPDSELDISVRIRLLQENRNSCSLLAVANQRHSHRSASANDRVSGWQELKLSLPARSDWYILELHLERKTLDASQSGSHEVDLGGVVLRSRRIASTGSESLSNPSDPTSFQSPSFVTSP